MVGIRALALDWAHSSRTGARLTYHDEDRFLGHGGVRKPIFCNPARRHSSSLAALCLLAGHCLHAPSNPPSKQAPNVASPRPPTDNLRPSCRQPCICQPTRFSWPPTPVHGHLHLLPAVDEPLLRRRNALLLLDALLYPRDLSPISTVACTVTRAGGGGAYLVVGFDIELDLLAGERAHSVGGQYSPVSGSGGAGAGEPAALT